MMSKVRLTASGAKLAPFADGRKQIVETNIAYFGGANLLIKFHAAASDDLRFYLSAKNYLQDMT